METMRNRLAVLGLAVALGLAACAKKDTAAAPGPGGPGNGGPGTGPGGGPVPGPAATRDHLAGLAALETASKTAETEAKAADAKVVELDKEVKGLEAKETTEAGEITTLKANLTAKFDAARAAVVAIRETVVKTKESELKTAWEAIGTKYPDSDPVGKAVRAALVALKIDLSKPVTDHSALIGHASKNLEKTITDDFKVVAPVTDVHKTDLVNLSKGVQAKFAEKVAAEKSVADAKALAFDPAKFNESVDALARLPEMKLAAAQAAATALQTALGDVKAKETQKAQTATALAAKKTELATAQTNVPVKYKAHREAQARVEMRKVAAVLQQLDKEVSAQASENRTKESVVHQVLTIKGPPPAPMAPAPDIDELQTATDATYPALVEKFINAAAPDFKFRKLAPEYRVKVKVFLARAGTVKDPAVLPTADKVKLGEIRGHQLAIFGIAYDTLESKMNALKTRSDTSSWFTGRKDEDVYLALSAAYVARDLAMRYAHAPVTAKGLGIEMPAGHERAATIAERLAARWTTFDPAKGWSVPAPGAEVAPAVFKDDPSETVWLVEGLYQLSAFEDVIGKKAGGRTAANQQSVATQFGLN